MADPQPSLFEVADPPAADPGPGAEPADPDADLDNQSGLGRGLGAIIPTLSGLEAPARPDRAARRRRRVPRGLSSLIPGSGDADEADERPAPTPADRATDPRPDAPDDSAVRQLRDDLVRALLDGLENTMALDLCAYLHKDGDGAPELFLRSPDLAALGTERAWALFEALRSAVDRGESGPFEAAGMRGLTHATRGRAACGLYAVARADGLADQEQEVARRFCSSFGRAVHQLAGSARGQGPDEAVELEVHQARDSVLARVRVADGLRSRPGQGRAGTVVEAVTRAVIDADGSGARFRYASEVTHGEDHAAVVLLESPDGSVALGSALIGHGRGRATADAAVRALAALHGEAD